MSIRTCPMGRAHPSGHLRPIPHSLSVTPGQRAPNPMHILARARRPRGPHSHTRPTSGRGPRAPAPMGRLGRLGIARTTREARRPALWRHSWQCLGDRPCTPQEMPSLPSRAHAAHVRPQLMRLRDRGTVWARGAHPGDARGAPFGPLATPQATPRRLRCSRGRHRWRVRGDPTTPQVPGLRGVPRAFRGYLGDPQSLRGS